MQEQMGKGGTMSLLQARGRVERCSSHYAMPCHVALTGALWPQGVLNGEEPTKLAKKKPAGGASPAGGAGASGSGGGGGSAKKKAG